MAQLFIVATPIGNMADITLRALEVLQSADVILAEDTRTTRGLLNRHHITTPMLSYHQHSGEAKFNKIRSLLHTEKTLALVSDAGTPGIHDPGNQLIARLVSAVPNLTITPIPGPSALIAAASVSGIPMERFLFLGFPPPKKGRAKFFTACAASAYPVVLYESKHRLLKTLAQLIAAAGDRFAIIARELTKQHEVILRGTLSHHHRHLAHESLKGEFVLIIAPESFTPHSLQHE